MSEKRNVIVPLGSAARSPAMELDCRSETRLAAADLEVGPVGALRHEDLHPEAVLEVVQVRDDQDLPELLTGERDGLHEALTALWVLGAETFVDDEGLEARTGPAD